MALPKSRSMQKKYQRMLPALLESKKLPLTHESDCDDIPASPMRKNVRWVVSKIDLKRTNGLRSQLSSSLFESLATSRIWSSVITESETPSIVPELLTLNSLDPILDGPISPNNVMNIPEQSNRKISGKKIHPGPHLSSNFKCLKPSDQDLKCGGRERKSGDNVTGYSAITRPARLACITISLANSIPLLTRPIFIIESRSKARKPQ